MMNNIELYNRRKKSIEERLVSYFPNYNKGYKFVPFSVKQDLLNIGLYELLVSGLRNKLSHAGMFYDCYLTKVSNGYWIGIDDLSLIILSDNVALLKELNKRKNYTLGEEEGGWCGMQYAMMQIAASDWDGLRETIKYLKGVTPPYDDFFHDINIYYQLYDGFLERDNQKIEVSLNALETHNFRMVRQSRLTLEKDISIVTLALGRLAWMYGMEVEIESKFVPNELLPFEPLEEYTIPYKFLRNFYREQGVDWRYDPVFPELQDWASDPENPNRNKGGFFNKLFS